MKALAVRLDTFGSSASLNRPPVISRSGNDGSIVPNRGGGNCFVHAAERGLKGKGLTGDWVGQEYLRQRVASTANSNAFCEKYGAVMTVMDVREVKRYSQDGVQMNHLGVFGLVEFLSPFGLGVRVWKKIGEGENAVFICDKMIITLGWRLVLVSSTCFTLLSTPLGIPPPRTGRWGMAIGS